VGVTYDLVYANEDMEDLGVLVRYALDLAIGADENDFELVVDMSSHVCREGYYIYIEGTEYGGIVDAIRVRTAEKDITYKGRTWQGILGSKVLEPDAGEDYLVISGEANLAIGKLLERIGLSGLFVASREDSGLGINNYRMNRYIDGYTGLVKMLASAGGKLKISFQNRKVVLEAVPEMDYSQDEQFDSDLVELDLEKGYHPVNHVICLGKGDLAGREVVHLYADREGGIGKGQQLVGLEEVTAVYENVNAESMEELEQGGISLMEESRAAASRMSMSFNSDDDVYDVGDTVGAVEHVTGIMATERISKKIVGISNGNINIEYKVGE